MNRTINRFRRASLTATLLLAPFGCDGGGASPSPTSGASSPSSPQDDADTPPTLKVWGEATAAEAVAPVMAKLGEHYHRKGGAWYAEHKGILYELVPQIRFGPALPLTDADRANGVTERRVADLMAWVKEFDPAANAWTGDKALWPGAENTRAFFVQLRNGKWEATLQDGEAFDETPCPDPDAWIAARVKERAARRETRMTKPETPMNDG